MIDNERYIFNKIASALRNAYKSIYITDSEITNTPPKFPAVSIIMSNSSVKEQAITFQKVENATIEEYKIEIYSNLTDGYGADEAKQILYDIDDIFSDMNGIRTFNEPIFNIDPTITRRVARYRILQIKQEV